MLKRILLPLDGSSLAECTLAHGVALARATEGSITLARVLEPAPGDGANQVTDPLQWHLRKAEAESYLKEVSNRLPKNHISVETVLLQGKPAEQVVDFARVNEIDLLVLSSHGRSGLTGWNISSVVQKIIYRAATSLMIVPAYQVSAAGAEEDLRYRHIVVPLDGSKRAECVLSVVDALARHHEADVLLLNVVVRPEMPRRAPLTPEDTALADKVVERNQAEAEKYLSQVGGTLDSRVEIRVLTSNQLIGSLHDVVETEQSDLVALSAHGYSGDTRRPFGSVVTSFIAYGSVPLLILQDLAPEEIEATQAEIVAEQVGKSESDKGGRAAVHVG